MKNQKAMKRMQLEHFKLSARKAKTRKPSNLPPRVIAKSSGKKMSRLQNSRERSKD